MVNPNKMSWVKKSTLEYNNGMLTMSLAPSLLSYGVYDEKLKTCGMPPSNIVHWMCCGNTHVDFKSVALGNKADELAWPRDNNTEM